MRICFLIAAHSRPEMLGCTLASVSSPRHICRVHLDRKGRTPELVAVVAAAAAVGDVREVTSAPVSWGGFSQVACELRGVREALFDPSWDYLVFMSGTDLLVRPLAELESLLEGAQGRSFIDRRLIAALEPRLRHTVERRSRWLHAEVAGRLVKTPVQLGWLRGVRPTHYGSQWHFLHRSFCEAVIARIDASGVPLGLRRCLIPDEFFWQNILNDAPDRIASVIPDNHRYAVFDGAPSPRWIRAGDVEAVVASGAMIARKFDPGVDAEAVSFFLARIGVRSALAQGRGGAGGSNLAEASASRR